MTKNVPTVEHLLDNKLQFHASKKAPKQRKKRDKHARYIYNLTVVTGLALYEEKCYHPKMEITVCQMETIVHNIGRMLADEVTALNKFNKTNEIPLFMEKSVMHTLKTIVNKKTAVKKVSRQASKNK